MKSKMKHQPPYSMKTEKDALISCPYQPGNLKISKTACRQRRQASRDDRFLQSVSNEFFQFTIRQGLRICRNCPLPL